MNELIWQLLMATLALIVSSIIGYVFSQYIADKIIKFLDDKVD